MSLCHLLAAELAGDPGHGVWVPPPALRMAKKLHKKLVLLLPVLLEGSTRAGLQLDDQKPCTWQHQLQGELCQHTALSVIIYTSFCWGAGRQLCVPGPTDLFH